MSANESQFKLDEKRQLDEDKPDFELETKTAKEINYN